MFKSRIKQNNNRRLNSVSGFTLIEMLVAVGIFMSIMTIAVGSLISIIGANKKAQSIKTTTDSVTFAMESISRDMRMGTNYKCLLPDNTFSNKNCPLDTGSAAVQYTNNSGAAITYAFNNKKDPTKGILTKTDCSISPCNTADLISQGSGVNITNMTFYVIGTDHELDADMTTKTQPRVIITASGLISVKGSQNTVFNLQTNISQGARR